MESRFFGKTRRGEDAALYTIRNRNGMVMAVTDFGATLHTLLVPDREGTLRDVVLGCDDPSGYERPSGTYFGATVGRNANRVGGASFTLNGKTYTLGSNDHGNNLHSGPDGYSYRIWQVKAATDSSITLTLHSPDGDQGYPGALTADVTYTLTDDNAVRIDYRAIPDADTPVNLTNHSYFNLNGHDSGSIEGHRVWVDADHFTPTDPKSIPTGEILPVDGTPMDFRTKKEVGRDIGADYQPLIFGRGYDHNWCLNNGGKFAKVAQCEGDCGIAMEVWTDLPGVQIYTGNFLTAEPGKDCAVYTHRQGICFETQFYPDAVNHANFPSVICRGGETFESTTVYRFVE